MAQIPDACECCPVTLDELRSRVPAQSLVIYKAMWMCPECLAKEKSLTEQSEKEADSRVAASRALSNNLINQARQIDDAIQLKEDIFNAHTVAIMDLKKAIDEDTAITNKPLALAEELHRRFTHLQQVIFDARSVLADAGNQQRAIQTYMNTISNQLRAEERAKLQLQDINYNPAVVKPAKVKKEGSSTKARGPKKFDKDALRNVCAKYNVPIDVVQLMVVSKNMTPEAAAEFVAKTMGK